MAQQNSNLTLSNSNSVTSVSPLEHESSPKNDGSLERGLVVTTFNSKAKGFSVAKGSDISSSDLLESGIFMKDSKYHPHNLDVIKNLIFDAFSKGFIKTNYYITEEPSVLNRIYRFVACPF